MTIKADGQLCRKRFVFELRFGNVLDKFTCDDY